MTHTFELGAGQLVVAAGGSIAYRPSVHEPWQGLSRFGLSAVLAIVNGDSGPFDLGLEVAAVAQHIPRQWEASVTCCLVDFTEALAELKRVFHRVYPKGSTQADGVHTQEALLHDPSGATVLLTEQSDASWPQGLRGRSCAVHVARINDLGLALAALHRSSSRGASPATLQIHGPFDMQVDYLELADKSALRAFLEEHERRLDQLEYCKRAGLLAHCRIDLSELLGDVAAVVDF